MEGECSSVELEKYTTITSSKRVHKADYVNDGVPFYRIKDVVLLSKGRLPTTLEYIKKEVFENFKEKFGSPKKGDILMSAVGATLGYAYLVNDCDGDFYFKDGNLLWLKNITNFEQKYLVYVFESSIFKKYLEEISKGAAQPAITIIKLKEFKIPLPPLPIQQQTVEYLDSIATKVDKIKQLNEQKLENLKALKASILDKAFRGEL
ncbi:restriction endonuclease subunit S [Francisella tularensis]|uniref:restriction endonuclease subunit S n=1 Tax=Francisella tularensis TaxID=263 RepID=UPI0008F6160F|nr:restriction endonuclease subunit S [Francisella tularensis]APA83321.1 Type I restriction-modification system, specificity subunit S [Francisella tularensis subsp. novicida PA10-7858]